MLTPAPPAADTARTPEGNRHPGFDASSFAVASSATVAPSRTRRLAGIAAVAIAGSACIIGVLAVTMQPHTQNPTENPTDAAATWVQYSDPGQNFTAEFPSQPLVEETQLNGRAITTYSAADSAALAQVVMVQAPQDVTWASGDTPLKETLTDLAANTNSQITAQIVSTRHGRHELDAHLENASNVTDARIFLVDSRMFVLAVSSTGEPHPALFGHLADSFHTD